MNAASLVVVTPVYEDHEASGSLFRELSRLFAEDVFCVVVDDGSIATPTDAASLCAAGLNGTVLTLKRNVGHQRAIAVGLNYVARHLPDAERIVVMDSDGEDRPEDLARLLQSLDASHIDLAVAQRRGRTESVRFKLFYLVYTQLFRLLTGRRIDFGNFMAMKRPALQRLVAMQELWLHIAGCVLCSKLRLHACPIDRGVRYAGRSKMNFVDLSLHGFKALMVFAENVLVRVGVACAVVATCSVLGGATAIALKTFGFATPGWFSVALGILLLVFLQTGTLTLMTLMLTGVVRGGTVANIDYQDFVAGIAHTGR